MDGDEEKEAAPDGAELESASQDSKQEPGAQVPRGRAAPSENAFVRFGLFFYGGMIALALVWRMGFRGESIVFADAAAEAAGISALRDLGLGLAAGLAVVALSSLLTSWTGFGERLARTLAEAIGPLSVPNALLLATASGLGEELLFRGAVQPETGLVLASLIFGALHFAPRRELLPWTAFAVLAGLGFGLLFAWTGNVVAPVVAHTTVNAINLPLLVRRYRRDGAPA